MPQWVAILNPNHYLKKAYIEKMKESVIEIDKLRDCDNIIDTFKDNEYIKKAYISEIDPSTGEVTINL